jgi:hypothetical protein
LVSDVLTIVSVPPAAPATVGSNCTLIVALWLELSVSGKVAPETVNPLPTTVAKLTVTPAVPVEVRVTDCVAGVLRLTFPKAMLVALMLSPGTPALNCRAKVCATPPALAVNVAV